MLLGSMARRLRTRIEFAEQELIIPSGPFEGLRFSCDRQPFTRLLLEELDKELWSRCFVTGPTQSGKSFLGFVLPVMYHLFEVEEDVICGVPQMELAKEKWQADLLPAISRSRFAELLPKKGAGSHGGTPTVIRFGNGTSLRFIPGGGSDKTRAGYTSRVVVITEVDGMDEAGEVSREADPITQLEARTRAFGNRKRIYGECTVSIEQGRTWQEYTKGTASRIALKCPRCQHYVTPEREDYRDWQGAETILEARQRATVYCPGCGEGWTEQDRREAHKEAKLVHRGQEIDPNGVVTGPLPGTDTFGFRWSAVNNLLVTTGDVGADEWKASRNPNEADAEKEMCQFVFAVPHKPDATLLAPLEAQVLMRRVGTYRRGEVPSDCVWVTVGADVGKWRIHWTAVAWKPDGTGFVIDYGEIKTGADYRDEEYGIVQALKELSDKCKMGWKRGEGTIQPSQVWIDTRYKGSAVCVFIRELGNDIYKPILGCGKGKSYEKKYTRPKDESNKKWVGDQYHFELDVKEGLLRAEINVDHWKSWLHSRLTIPTVAPSAIVLLSAPPAEHHDFAKQLTAEHQVEEFIPGEGTVTYWVAHARDNHWLDSTNYACAAGHFCGVRLVKADMKPRVEQPQNAESKPFVRQPDQRRSGGWFRR